MLDISIKSATFPTFRILTDDKWITITIKLDRTEGIDSFVSTMLFAHVNENVAI